MRIPGWLSDWFFKNPIAWLLLVALLIAEYANYNKAEQITRLCELTAPHPAEVVRPGTTREELDRLCLENADE